MGLDKAIMKVGGALGVIGGIQCVASSPYHPYQPSLTPTRAPRRRPRRPGAGGVPGPL